MNNNIITREKLLDELKIYRNILAKDKILYLKSLIELDISIVEDHISEQDREILNQLKLFRQIATYNIYERAIKKLEETDLNLSMIMRQNFFSCAAVVDKELYNIFSFKFDSNYTSDDIGTINLFQVKSRPYLRKMELKLLLAKYMEEEKQRNNTNSTYWRDKHLKELKKLRKEYETIEQRKKLTSHELKLIEIENQCCNSFLEDYGLQMSDFSDTRLYKSTVMKKLLVKQKPGIAVTINVNYM